MGKVLYSPSPISLPGSWTANGYALQNASKSLFTFLIEDSLLLSLPHEASRPFC
jgi:hypothetical protein